MANRSKTRRPAASSVRPKKRRRATSGNGDAQGRLDHGPPIAVIDIGSNSVRLVVYEGLTRSPTPIFNEKVLAGLGREVQSKKLLAADAVAKALDALVRFRALCDALGTRKVWAVAIAQTFATFMRSHSARKRRTEVSAFSTASAASRPVVCTSRPRPASTFSLKIGVGLRVSPSYTTRRTEFEPMSMTATGGP